jgi:hypothetical protein
MQNVKVKTKNKNFSFSKYFSEKEYQFQKFGTECLKIQV